jgi:hypothetical protein
MTMTTADGPAGRLGSRAWPFVVTRNRLLDWRPMVAPDFMIAQGGEYLLVHAADPGDGPVPSPVFERIVTTKRYGDLTLLASSRPATADLIGGSAQEQLVDRVGRPIQLIEGLVLPGRHPGCAARWQAQLAWVDAIAQQSFLGFWQSEDETEPPASSRALTETGPAAEREVGPGQVASDEGVPGDPGQVQAYGRGHPSPRQVIAAAVTVIASLVVLYVIVRVTRR